MKIIYSSILFTLFSINILFTADQEQIKKDTDSQEDLTLISRRLDFFMEQQINYRRWKNPDQVARSLHALLKLEEFADISNQILLDKLNSMKINLRIINDSQDNALHMAAWNGFTKTVEFLIFAGFDTNFQNKWGNTALHEAAFCNYTSIVTALLKAGTDKNIVNNIFQTPAKMAYANRYHGLAYFIRIWNI